MKTKEETKTNEEKSSVRIGEVEIISDKPLEEVSKAILDLISKKEVKAFFKDPNNKLSSKYIEDL